jgi:hypothetical protein
MVGSTGMKYLGKFEYVTSLKLAAHHGDSYPNPMIPELGRDGRDQI